MTDLDGTFGLVESAYDKVAADYDSDYLTPLSLAENREISKIFSTFNLRRYVNDVGCGTGLALDLDLIPHPESYIGIDASEGMLNRLVEKHPGTTVHHGNGWAKIYHPAQDVISLFGSPSYTPIVDVIAGAKHHLRAGGRFFLMPYARGRYQTAWKHSKHVDTHSNLWFMYSADQWRRFFVDAGAQNVEVRGFNLLRRARLLGIEAPLAKRWPDRCQYLIITGEF